MTPPAVDREWRQACTRWSLRELVSLRRPFGRSWVLIALSVASCAPTADLYMPRYGKGAPTPQNLTVCHGYGCAFETAVHLSGEEWAAVSAMFALGGADAAEERWRAAQAVALLERLVGKRTGTHAHQRRALVNFADASQLDCIDETANTWTYLSMMAGDGLFRHHYVGPLIHQGSLLTFDLHNSAVLVESRSGARFAIDPTLVDATEQPPVIPIEQWLAQWPPAAQ